MLNKLLTTSVFSLGIGLVCQAPVLSASIGFFNNLSYTDPTTSNNIRNILVSFGHTVNEFSSLDPSDWQQATQQNQLLLFNVITEEIEPDFSEETEAVIRNYVAGGGGLIFTSVGNEEFTFWNTLFNTDIEIETRGGQFFLNSANAAGTIFADGPSVLQPSSTVGVSIASLPPEARSIYDNRLNSSVAFISSFGNGNLAYISFDFFDPTEEPLWGDVLDLAVEYVAVPEPSLLGAAVMISLGGGFMKSKSKSKNKE